MFFSHYWRRREPPVFLRCGCFRSGFIVNVIFLVLFLFFENIFIGKTNGSPPFRLGLLDFLWACPPPSSPSPPCPSSSTSTSSTSTSSTSTVSGEAILGTQRYLQLTPPYWRRRDPPVFLRIPNFHSGFIVNVNFLVLFLFFEKIFIGKTNGFFTFLNFSIHFPFGGLSVFIFPLQMLCKAFT